MGQVKQKQIDGLLDALNARSTEWKDSVIAIESDSANISSPSSGDRYLVDWDTTAQNDFSGHEGKIAEYDGTQWDFIVPTLGSVVITDADFSVMYVCDQIGPITWRYNGSAPSGNQDDVLFHDGNGWTNQSTWKMGIGTNGEFYPSNNDAQDLGKSTNRIRSIFLGSTIDFSTSLNIDTGGSTTTKFQSSVTQSYVDVDLFQIDDPPDPTVGGESNTLPSPIQKFTAKHKQLGFGVNEYEPQITLQAIADETSTASNPPFYLRMNMTPRRGIDALEETHTFLIRDSGEAGFAIGQGYNDTDLFYAKGRGDVVWKNENDYFLFRTTTLHANPNPHKNVFAFNSDISNSSVFLIKGFNTTGGTGSYTGDSILRVRTWDDNPVLDVKPDQTVGIGTESTTSMLTVKSTGTSNIAIFQDSGGGSIFDINSSGIRYTDGSEAVGYVLQSDANGDATWVDPATLSVDHPDIVDDRIPRGTGTTVEDGTWINAGNDIYPVTDGSNIGQAGNRIGTIFMASTLDVSNDLIVDISPSNSTVIGNPALTANSTPTDSPKLILRGEYDDGLSSDPSDWEFVSTPSSSLGSYGGYGFLRIRHAQNNPGVNVVSVAASPSSTGGAIGINVDDPAHTLELDGASGKDPLHIKNDGNSVFRILDGGNIGVGTDTLDNSNVVFQLEKNINSSQRFRLKNTNTGTSSDMRVALLAGSRQFNMTQHSENNTSSSTGRAGTLEMGGQDAAMDMFIGTSPSGYFNVFGSASAKDLFTVVGSAGRIGIHNFSPATILHLSAEGDNTQEVRFENTTAGSSAIMRTSLRNDSANGLNTYVYSSSYVTTELQNMTSLYASDGMRLGGDTVGIIFQDDNVTGTEGAKYKDASLGIGSIFDISTDPSASLHVRGKGSTSATSSLLIEDSGSLTLLKVEDGGNVGIGTNSPDKPLTVDGQIKNIEGGDITALENTQGGGYAGMVVVKSSQDWRVQANNTEFRIYDNTNALAAWKAGVNGGQQIFDAESGGFAFKGGSSDFLFETSSQAIFKDNVTTLTDGGTINSPEIVLTGKYDSDATAGITVSDYHSVLQHIIEDDAPTSRLALSLGGTEYLTVKNTNKVGINRTDPVYQLDMQPPGNDDGIQVRRDGTNVGVRLFSNDTAGGYLQLYNISVDDIVRFNKIDTGFDRIATGQGLMLGDHSTAAFKLDILPDSDNDGIQIRKTAGTHKAVEILSSNSTGGYLNLYDGSAFPDVIGTQLRGEGDNYINDKLVIGGTGSPSARLHIIGEGSTSATSNILLDNSGSQTLLQVKDDGQFTIGLNATTDDKDKVTIGENANTVGGTNSVAIGLSASATSGTGVAIGPQSSASGGGSVAIGNTSNANSTGALSIGDADATGSRSIAIGHASSTTGNFAYTIGAETTNGTSNSFMVGDNQIDYFHVVSDDKLRLTPVDASSGTTLKDGLSLNMQAKYWDGASSVTYDADIQHIMVTASPVKSRLAFSVNNTESISITDDQEVGINETDPRASLHIGFGSSNPYLVIESGTHDIVTVDQNSRTFIDQPSAADASSGINSALYVGANATNAAIRMGVDSGFNPYIQGGETNSATDTRPLYINPLSGSKLLISADVSGNVAIGTSTISSSVRTLIEGEGSTSATSSLVVQDSGASDMFEIRDDGKSSFTGQLYVNSVSQDTLDAGIGDFVSDGTEADGLRIRRNASATGTVRALQVEHVGTSASSNRAIVVNASGASSSNYALINNDGGFALGHSQGLSKVVMRNRNSEFSYVLRVLDSGASTNILLVNDTDWEMEGVDYTLRDGNILSEPLDVTADGGTTSSPTVTLRGKYDSDGGAGITSTNYDAVLQHEILSTAPSSKLSFKIDGNENFKISSDGYPEVPEYTIATLPPIGSGGGLIAVTDETGGYVLAFSDGTNWRRVTDRAIVS